MKISKHLKKTTIRPLKKRPCKIVRIHTFEQMVPDNFQKFIRDQKNFNEDMVFEIQHAVLKIIHKTKKYSHYARKNNPTNNFFKNHHFF